MSRVASLPPPEGEEGEILQRGGVGGRGLQGADAVYENRQLNAGFFKELKSPQR